MKTKEKKSLSEMKQEELAKIIAETKEKLADHAITRYSKQSKNVREVREMRKKLAVASSMYRIKELAHE